MKLKLRNENTIYPKESTTQIKPLEAPKLENGLDEGMHHLGISQAIYLVNIHSFIFHSYRRRQPMSRRA